MSEVVPCQAFCGDYWSSGHSSSVHLSASTAVTLCQTVGQHGNMIQAYLFSFIQDQILFFIETLKTSDDLAVVGQMNT
jgi:hypothetical protein